MDLDELTRAVSLALGRLESVGRPVSLAELRRVIETEGGESLATVSDAELRRALLELHGPGHASAVLSGPGDSVTCSPLPDGWIPAGQGPHRT